jgi:hypothetical protein
MHCYSAWKAIPVPAVTATLDTIRTRVLQFVLELEVENPDAGEVGAEPPSPTRVSQIAATTVLADRVFMAVGGQEASQTIVSNVTVTPGNRESLCLALAGLGIDPQALGELDAALDEDERDPGRKPGMGAAVQRWLGNATTALTTGTATGLVTQALLRFFGIA